MDEKKSNSESRVSPQERKTDSQIKGPLDPSVPYAVPQKKNTFKKPRHKSYEQAMGKSSVNKALYNRNV